MSSVIDDIRLTCAMSVVGILQYHISKTFVFLVASLMYVTEVSNGRPSLLPMIMDNPKVVTHEEGDMAVLYCSVLNLEDHTDLCIAWWPAAAALFYHAMGSILGQLEMYNAGVSIGQLSVIDFYYADDVGFNSQVTWRKIPNSSPLTIGTKSWTRDLRIHAEHVPNSSHWNLVIERVDSEDAGEYECQVSKRKSQLRHKVTLVVKVKPIALLPRIEISGENVLKAGSLLTLTCNATLTDVAVESIAWIKDGEPLLQGKDNRYSVHTSVTLNDHNSGIISSRLEVKDSRTDDSGVYLCRSTERIQMAGVKVDIQGTYNFKRADTKKVDNPKELSTLIHSGTELPTSLFHWKRAGHLCGICTMLQNIIFCFLVVNINSFYWSVLF